MTTLHIEDIRHKKIVPNKYKPNSYRIFCEDIGNQSIPDDVKYSSQAPPIYTQPFIVPAQAIEDRNRPHAGRMAGFLRENAHTINEPINRITTKHLESDEEKKWWQWNLPKEEENNWKDRKRSSSQSIRGDNSNNNVNEHLNRNESLQTTYQKEHGYLKNLPSNEPPTRHSFNPNTSKAVGIVPINDLTAFSNSNEQRVFVDKMSFEHQYDSRSANNYPNRGKRHGGFVIEQVEPKPSYGTKVRPDSNKGSSVWDAMHPSDDLIGANFQPRFQKTREVSANPESFSNQRRDPIGYFEDTKFGGSLGSAMPNSNPGPNFNRNISANTNEKSYKPSWSQNGSAINLQQTSGDQQSPNDLLDRAMMYQRAVATHDYDN